jgi:hypothetical protein
MSEKRENKQKQKVVNKKRRTNTKNNALFPLSPLSTSFTPQLLYLLFEIQKMISLAHIIYMQQANTSNETPSPTSNTIGEREQQCANPIIELHLIQQVRSRAI